jgi:hypothetical protein
VLLDRSPSRVKPRLDIPGVVSVSGALFCLVYGFSNAATHNWHTPSTYGFLAAGVVLLVAFAFWQGRAANPLLPPRRGTRPEPGRCLPVDAHRRVRHVRNFPVPDLLPAADAGLLAGRHGLRVLADGRRHRLAANLSTIVAMPRVGPKPLVGLGMVIAPSINTGRQALTGLALAHGYDTAFWWTAGLFAGGAVAGGILFRRGPLYQRDAASGSPAGEASLSSSLNPQTPPTPAAAPGHRIDLT